MKKSDTVYVLGSVFAAMTAFFYCCKMWFSIKLPRYYPLEHTWKWVKEKGVPSQDWYGTQIFAYLAAGVVVILVYLVLNCDACKKVNLSPRLTKWIGVCVTITIVICMSYMLYYEFDKWGIF